MPDYEIKNLLLLTNKQLHNLTRRLIADGMRRNPEVRWVLGSSRIAGEFPLTAVRLKGDPDARRNIPAYFSMVYFDPVTVYLDAYNIQNQYPQASQDLINSSLQAISDVSLVMPDSAMMTATRATRSLQPPGGSEAQVQMGYAMAIAFLKLLESYKLF